MKNKKAVKLLATINILAMLTMLGQPVVKAQQPKDIYPVEINETNFPDELIRKDIINIVDDNKDFQGSGFWSREIPMISKFLPLHSL